MRWGLVAIACAGCGRVNFTPLGDGGAAGDGGPDTAFSAPVPLTELNSGMGEDDPSLTADLLEIYFSSSRSGSQRVWRSVRAAATDPWPAPQMVTEVDGANINNPKISLDGLALIFSSTRAPNLGGSDLWLATRPDRGSVFTFARIDELATVDGDYEAYLVMPDALQLFYTHNPGGEPGLWYASRPTPADLWSGPFELTNLNSPNYDGSTWVNATLTALMFNTERGTDRDIYYSTRAAPGDAWADPLPFAEINTSANESDPWLSPDGHTFVFVSDKDGSSQIYMATR